MKKQIGLLTLLFILFALQNSFAQVSINDDGSPPDNSAMLEIKSNSKGLLIPRLTTSQREALSLNAKGGLIVFDSDLLEYCFHNGYGWQVGLGFSTWGIDGGPTFLGGDSLSDYMIGTLNPLGKFHVHDPIRHNSKFYLTPQSEGPGDSSTLVLAGDRNASSGMEWTFDGIGDRLELRGISEGQLTSPHLLVDRNTGNIAIGNSFATGYKLSVDGKVICTELRVNLTDDWPDYVFSKDYSLMPLDELHHFISLNGHLPNIPSASDIGGSGIDVGEMQRLMMEKIEELSLYIIKQQQQIDELQKKLATLR